MNAENKIACNWLGVLHLKETLGSVSEAYRQRRITRTMFYEYKSAFKGIVWKA